MKKPSANLIAYFLIALLLIGGAVFVGIRLYQEKIATQKQAALDAYNKAMGPYLNFSDEVYTTIQQNYWNTMSDDQLSNLYLLAANYINTSTTVSLPSKNLSGVNSIITAEIQNKSADDKKTFVTTLANVVLANLQPFGRSSLYTQASVQALNNELNNVDTSTNLYQDLGVSTSSSQSQIASAYQQKSAALEKQNTPQAKQQLALVQRAYAALGTAQNRQTYDQTGQEPAVVTQILAGGVYYVKVSRFAADLMQELQAAASGTPAGAPFMILDLRRNIGGDIDQLTQVLGDFLGPNQDAFEFYHQGTFTPYPAVGGILPQFSKFSKVAILADGQSQSSTEMMTASLKKYHYGIVVGTTTRGWGTVERVFPLQNQIDNQQTYSVFLVHSLTVDETRQPIEGRGVKPDINISDKNWPQELMSQSNSSALVAGVQHILAQ